MHSSLCASIVLSTFLLSSLYLLAEDGPNLIRNPGFEDPTDAPASFSLFIPSDSQKDNCRYTISTDTFHSGKQAALMQADDFTRFSLGPNGTYPVVAGDTYRLGVWLKAGGDFQMESGSPGVVIRVNQTTGTPPKPAGFTFIYLNNTISQAGPPDYSPLPVSATLPTEWTHIEVIVKVPAGVDRMVPGLFLWKAKGSLYVDDFTLQKVDPTTPLSPAAGG